MTAQKESLIKYAEMASSELSSVLQLEGTVRKLAYILGFPYFLAARLIAPFLSGKFTLNDCYFLLDLIGLDDSSTQF